MRNHFMRAKKRNAEFVGAASCPVFAGTGLVEYNPDHIPGAQAGDLAILYWFDPVPNDDPSDIVGWTTAYSNGGSYISEGIWYKILSSSDVSVSFAPSSGAGDSLMVVFRNASFGSRALMFNAFGAPNPPSLSGFTPNDIVLALGGYESSTPLVEPSGYTLAKSAYSLVAPNTAVAAAFKTGVIGTQDPGAFTGGSAANDAHTIRIIGS